MKSIFTFYSLQLVKEAHKYELSKRVSSPEDVADFCKIALSLHNKAEEYCYLFTLNVKNDITGVFEVSHGSVNTSVVEPREIYKRALLMNASNIIIVHNHPSGDTTPSADDKATCKRLIEAGKILGITLLDFIIIGNNDYYSFKVKGLM